MDCANLHPMHGLQEIDVKAAMENVTLMGERGLKETGRFCNWRGEQVGAHYTILLVLCLNT